MSALHSLTATEIVRLIRTRKVSPTDVVRALAEQISKTEPAIQAWAALDIDQAFATAKSLEAKQEERAQTSELFGVPLALKDVFHVRGFATGANFNPYQEHVRDDDSAVAEFLRKSGAIILGKHTTAQFAASIDPPKTTNPWDADRTPGGSSSGSGASVAARHVPVSIGTQAGGSNLRPAAYCGVFGMKPTFGLISRHGLLPVSWTLDHAGIIARSVSDLSLVLQVLSRHDSRDPFSIQTPRQRLYPMSDDRRTPRLGVVGDLIDQAQSPVAEATKHALGTMETAGAELSEVELAVPMELLSSVHWVIGNAETGALHEEQYRLYSDEYQHFTRAKVEIGQVIPSNMYIHALRVRHRLRTLMMFMFDGVDALIAPTVSNLPPSRDTTGDHGFQAIWSLFGFPNITIPLGIGEEGLPRALQIIGSPFDDQKILSIAAWCEAIFGAPPNPFETESE